MDSVKIDTVIFDLGGVLVDWNPEYLYTKIFNGDMDKMKWFLENVCTSDWNIEQDAGRSFENGCKILIEKFPEYQEEIEAYFQRWEEMLKGEIKGTVLILKQLKSLNKVKLYALTNWSAETFPIAKRRFGFLKLFEDIVVSGDENTRKPFPKIYNITLDRYHLSPKNCLFIDDSKDNVKAAKSLNINALHFKTPKKLALDLKKFNVLS